MCCGGFDRASGMIQSGNLKHVPVHQSKATPALLRFWCGNIHLDNVKHPCLSLCHAVDSGRELGDVMWERASLLHGFQDCKSVDKRTWIWCVCGCVSGVGVCACVCVCVCVCAHAWLAVRRVLHALARCCNAALLQSTATFIHGVTFCDST